MTSRDRDSRDPGSDRVASGWSKFHVASLLGIAAVVVCAYANSLEVPFVFDDRPNISENPHIRIEGLAWRELWSAGTLSRAHQRPVANMSFALNRLAGGDDVRGYHLVNVCIHLLNGILVYALALATIRRAGAGRARDLPESATLWIPLAAALLFVSHPIQTQAVTYPFSA
jgi:hypothetical protein